jgi:hypothetical protein
MGLRVVEIDTFRPGAQTSASLQIATLKDKFSFQHLWRHCVGAGTSQGEGGGWWGAQLFVNGGDEQCSHVERWNVQIERFFVADCFNLWLFWANKFDSGNIIYVLMTVMEIIVKKSYFLVFYGLCHCYVRYGQLTVSSAKKFCINEHS